MFFGDTGIRNALLNTFSIDEFRPDVGALWENWAVAEVARRNAALGSVKIPVSRRPIRQFPCEEAGGHIGWDAGERRAR